MRWRKSAKDQTPEPTAGSDEPDSVVATSGPVHDSSLKEERSVVGHEPVATPEEPEEEPHGAHAKRGGFVLPGETPGAHVRKGDPLLSVEGRALHAKRGEALTEDHSEPPTVAMGTPEPAGPADEVTAQDGTLAAEADSLTTKRRTARTKKRKARRSKRLGTDPAAATNSGPAENANTTHTSEPQG